MRGSRGRSQMITALTLSPFMHSVVERHLACLAQTPPPTPVKRRLVHMKRIRADNQ